MSPLCQTPSWTEWLYNKAMINLLYFCGMTGFVKETLLQRYFSPVSCLQIFYLFPGICCKILLSSNCHKHQNLWRSLGLMFLYCSSWQEVRAACLEGTDVLMTYRRVSLSGLQKLLMLLPTSSFVHFVVQFFKGSLCKYSFLILRFGLGGDAES